MPAPSVSANTSALLVLALCACALLVGSPVQAATGDSSSITVAVPFDPPVSEQIDTCLADYAQAHPGTTIELQEVDKTTLTDTLQGDSLSGQTPDVFFLTTVQAAELARQDELEQPPESLMKPVRERMDESLQEQLTLEGLIWGPPVGVDTWLLVSNRQQLKQAGYDRAPQSLQEWREVAAQIGFTLLDTDQSLATVLYAMMQSDETDPFEDSFKGTNLNTPAAIGAVQLLNTMTQQDNTRLEADLGRLADNLANGDTGMAILPSSARPALNAVVDRPLDELFRVSALPFGDTWQSVREATVLAVHKQASNPQAAWQLVEALTESGSMPGSELSCLQSALSEAGVLPVPVPRPDSEPFRQLDAFSRNYLVALRSDRLAPRPAIAQGARIEQMIADAMREAITPTGSPSASMNTLDRTVHDQLNRYYLD